jgi:hypothetical protein
MVASRLVIALMPTNPEQSTLVTCSQDLGSMSRVWEANDRRAEGASWSPVPELC